jgi:hypothetical protein
MTDTQARKQKQPMTKEQQFKVLGPFLFEFLTHETYFPMIRLALLNWVPGSDSVILFVDTPEQKFVTSMIEYEKIGKYCEKIGIDASDVMKWAADRSTTLFPCIMQCDDTKSGCLITASFRLPAVDIESIRKHGFPIDVERYLLRFRFMSLVRHSGLMQFYSNEDENSGCKTLPGYMPTARSVSKQDPNAQANGSDIHTPAGTSTTSSNSSHNPPSNSQNIQHVQ